MNPFCLSTLRVLLALSHIFVLHLSLVSCKLQHDPGGSVDFDLHDTKAVIGKYFNYSIPTPSRIAKHALHYEVLEVGTSTIPSWLVFNQSSHSFHGVPLITDKGFYLMKVSLISLSENASSLQAHDVFAIDVDFETSQELTKKDILEGVGARPHHVLSTAKQLSEEISCRRNEIKTMMFVVFDTDVNLLNGSSRVSLISKLASFVNQPLEEFRISSKHSSVIDKLQVDTVVAAGPGNIHSAGSREGVVVSWPLPCASQTLINQFPKVMARNIASGHFRDTTGFDVISWHISKVKDSDVKARGRSRRQAVMTVVPTPKPSQTASVVTTSSLIPVSSTVQSVQTLFTSSVESTLLFSPSSSDQSMSPFLSRTSGSILSTTPLDSSSTQVSLYSPSQSVQTLSTVVTESIQSSLSQSPFMTSFPTFLLSPTAMFSSTMPVSQLSPTSHQRTTSLSTHQTTISTAMDISESTTGVVISSLQLSTNVISPSTSVFPNFESTSSLVGSPSLFLSTEIISTSVFFVTESPSVSSVESMQLSDSVTTVMLFSPSSTSVLLATSSISHLSIVFSSNFPSTLQSSEPETSFILQTSSSTRSGSLIPSSLVSKDSSLILSSTLTGTSVFETISSIRYTSTEISTALQTTLAPSPSTLLSTHLLFSSQILTSFLSSSEMILSSTESFQTSSHLISTSFAETSSGSSVTPVISTETSLTLQINSSTLSTYQTEVLSSVMTTDFSSVDVSVTRVISMTPTALPSSPVQSEIQTSDIVQSMTVLPTATMVPSITVSSSDSASPGTQLTASSTSASVSDTFSQLVPSTLVMTPSLSGMVSSSFVVPDVTSLSSVIEVSTLSSTEETTVSPSLYTGDLSSTAMFIESTYLSEFLSSTVAVDTSLLTPSLPPESQPLTSSFLETTVSSSLAFLTSTFPVSTSVMTSQIQSSSGSASRTGMSVIPTTSFQTPIISTVGATTLMTEISSFVSHVSSGAPSFSESSLILSLPGTSDFLVQSSSLTLSSMSASTYVSSAPSVSLPLSELSMSTSQDTTTFSTSLPFTLDSSSATSFPVFSTIVTSTSLFVPFASSTPPGVYSMSDSLAPSEFTTTLIQKSTSLGLESDGSSTTFFFSEGQSETLTPSFFATSTGQQFASSTLTPSFFATSTSQQFASSIATQQSSFPQSDMLSSTVIQASISSTSLFMSSVGSPSTPYSSTAGAVSSLTSSETPDFSSGFSDSQTTVVPSITSSLPETESLVSTVSPPLSTPSQLMSTRAPSSFLSSTQGVFISSSSNPTSSSSPVPSTLMMSSSTIILSASPTVPRLSSVVGQTSFLSSLPSSDASLPMSTLLVSTSEIQPTPSSSSPVDVSSTPPSTTELTTPPPETTTELGNREPIIQHPIDEIIVALGDVLQFPIPEDTFLDAEDGLTFDLQLDLLTPDNQPVSPSHWLQLVNNQQTLAGVPLDVNLTVMRNEYLLSATDSEGLVAYDAFVVKVQERALDYNHEFVITLENDFQSFFDDSQNIVSFCDNVASFLNDQNTDAFSVASVAEGSVVVTYSNKTIPTKYCEYKTIDDIFSSLAFSNGTPTNAFKDALLPDYMVTDVERIFLNLCSATTMPPFTNVTESPTTEINILLVTVLPASLIAFLLLICFLILCCCYKRKRGGEEFLLREEKPIYAKKRKPIYLDGELDDKEPRAASHPVILPIDVDPVKASRPFKRKSHESSIKPRPPPPQYRLPDYAQVNLGMDDFEDDFENNLFEMEPPTYTSQPVLHDAPDSKPLDDRPPPLYRLPPPYQSQDRGFFEESDI